MWHNGFILLRSEGIIACWLCLTEDFRDVSRAVFCMYLIGFVRELLALWFLRTKRFLTT